MSAVLKKAVKLNHSLTHPGWYFQMTLRNKIIMYFDSDFTVMWCIFDNKSVLVEVMTCLLIIGRLVCPEGCVPLLNKCSPIQWWRNSLMLHIYASPGLRGISMACQLLLHCRLRNVTHPILPDKWKLSFYNWKLFRQVILHGNYEKSDQNKTVYNKTIKQVHIWWGVLCTINMLW